MRLKREADILDESTRKAIIKEICGPENQQRKDSAYKRYDIFKDQTKYYVIDELHKQFDQETVKEMSYAISNVSLGRKIIEKLSKVYTNGATRKVEETSQGAVKEGDTNTEDATNQIEDFVKATDFETQMKKNNQFLKLQKNTLVYPKPCPEEQPDGSYKYQIKIEVLNPYLYDVIENPYDREKPMCVILSDYSKQSMMKYTTGDASTVDRGPAKPPASSAPGDGTDQIIADSPADAKLEDQRVFIWWTKNYHFTTNVKGEIVDSEYNPTGQNPILMLPFVSFNIGQDGQYWAKGGDDLVDAAVLVNSMITNVLNVGVMQGYGQFWMTGKNLPKNIKVGPTRSICLEYEKDEDPTPALGFATASPQLQELQNLIEMYVALTLTTNNLSTKGVSTKLAGGQDFPSGIAMVIDGAESIEDINEQRQIFIDKEPKIWEICRAWMDAYSKFLLPPFDAIKLPKGDIVTVFNDQNIIMSESEKLDNLKKRQDLGINTELELIMKDRPELSEEQAKAKLKDILENKMKRQAEAMQNAADMANNNPNAANNDPNANPQGSQINESGKKPGQQDPNNQ